MTDKSEEKPIKNVGLCFLCKTKFPHRVMKRHIAKCLESEKINAKTSPGKGSVYLIHMRAGDFWLYVEMNSTETLKALDSLLREVWLECCGHLSAFTIGRESFASDAEEDDKNNDFDDRSMNICLQNTIPVGTTFLHEYDFGSTTTLQGVTLSERTGHLKERFRFIAQNDLPNNIICSDCQGEAVNICPYCETILCETCSQYHHDECNDYDEDSALPIVNSPRMGVCAYTGQ